MQKTDFDVIVVGAGHAGVEAAAASARLGARTLLTTIDLNSVSYMACNPSIGGVGKSHLVVEIDALGGLMPQIADKTCIQMRTLNASNGPAVHAFRAQIDKHDYHKTMLKTLRSYPNLSIKECEVISIEPSGGCDLKSCAPAQVSPLANRSAGASLFKIVTAAGDTISCNSVVVCTGVYLNSCVLVGHTSKPSGPVGFAPATHLTKSLADLGLNIRRFKTGTPPRVADGSIDYTKTEEQPPDTEAHFSTMSTEPTRNFKSCHLTYTNERTHQIIRDNIKKSALFGGLIKGTGPRYCPSIEDKITRFPLATRHQCFLEPESLSTDEVYLQGMSTSLPLEVQEQFVHTMGGLEHAKILKPAYAIEYDCIDSTQLDATLMCKHVAGLFFAGQVNGTSGYEEAAAQGIIAGCNATNRKLILSRTNSYIGVLVDDLVTLGTNEPYRMFTSRAEHRLYLRQDNADQRLTPIGRQIGLVDDARWKKFSNKLSQINEYKKNPNAPVGDDIKKIVEIEKLYAGYMAREETLINETRRNENTPIPADIDYEKITALRRESQIKLQKIRPANIAQAMRISGVTPADINVLLVWLRRGRF